VKKIVAMLIITGTLFMPTITHAELSPLQTQTGNNISLSLSSYQYQEPGLVSLKGSKIGLDMLAIQVLQNGLFIRGDLRYAFGTVDYNSNGTGSASGEPDWYIETRTLVGKDWWVQGMVLSPFTGLGYRFLFNDGRGVTSTGASGYRRESNYFYLPLGVSDRFRLTEQSNLETQLEYDYLLSGRQITRLTDTGLGFSNVTNNQHTGYGLKLSVMYQKNNWAIGNYLHYWNIGRSDSTILYRNGTLYGTAWEPKNNTVELGIKILQRF
jgi:hypothetical protein